MYDYSNYSVDTATQAGMGGAFAIQIIISLAVMVLMIVSQWKIFKKANKPGWAAIVPIYNVVVLFQVCKLSPWLIILMFVPFVNFVAIIVLSILVGLRLAKAFGKGVGYAVGLMFLSVIFYPMLAFGDATYQE